jgi:hypothetical protein
MGPDGTWELLKRHENGKSPITTFISSFFESFMKMELQPITTCCNLVAIDAAGECGMKLRQLNLRFKNAYYANDLESSAEDAMFTNTVNRMNFTTI